MLENLTTGDKRVYFASDMHLGAPSPEASRPREKTLVRWLDSIADDAAAVVLVGDIFDFWYEYRKVVPRGYVRLLGKLAELTDSGIPIILFTGNHDLWMSSYLEDEIGATLYKDPQVFEAYGKKIFIAHGDGLGKGDYSYKLLKKVFTNPLCIWLFGRLHPNFAFGLAHRWSRHSRMNGGISPFDESTDYLFNFSKEVELADHHDYYIFGHRHLPMTKAISPNAMYINIGEWIDEPHFAVLGPDGVSLQKFE